MSEEEEKKSPKKKLNIYHLFSKLKVKRQFSHF